MRSKTIYPHKDVTITFKEKGYARLPKELTSSTGQKVTILTKMIGFISMSIKVNDQLVYEEDIRISGSLYEVAQKIDKFFEKTQGGNF